MSPQPFDQVGVENIEATGELVSHLIAAHGHRRIGFIAGAPGLSTTDERIDGYRLALQRANIAFDPELLRSGDSTSSAAARPRASCWHCHRAQRRPSSPAIT
jgi:LacI family transcriptional regulator